MMSQTIRLAHLGIAVPLLGLALYACGGEGVNSPPPNGTLQVTTATSGVEPDPDGYSIQIDAGAATAIGNTETRTFTDVTPGGHLVQLGGLAANCSVESDQRPVTVVAGETASVSFTVTCGPTTGGLSITSSTSGSDPDPDGYSISVDGAESGPLGVTATVVLGSLAPGVHFVALTGVAANCQIQGDNIRSVTVTAGADASVAYGITCVPPPPGAGSLRISTATTGAGADPNGYSFVLDGGAATPIASAATTTLQSVAPGAHTVQLAGVSANCSLQGPNPRPVTVASSSTADVSFAVSCAATTGTVQVSVSTSGSPAAPDGYVLKLDGAGTGNPVPVNGSVSFANVPGGSHVVALSGLTENCSVDGGLSKSTTVTAGVTATVSFAVTCAGATGSIQVITATTGGSLDFDGYTLTLDGNAGQPIDINAPLTLTNVSPGDHSVGLSGVQSNCTIAEANPRPVPVSALVQASVTFTVTCVARIGSIAFATLLEPGIFLVNPDGTDPTKPANGARPIWSPDGQKVLYSAGDQLNVINADGSGQATLATISRGGPTVYEWSPDGRMIAFCTQTNPADDPGGLDSDLWLIQADGTGQTRLAANALSAAWSPDGSKLAFGDVLQRLHVINADGSGLTPLTHDSLTARDPVWAPDGTEIVFNANLDIYRINADGSGLANLTTSPAVDQMPTLSRDGNWIVFITRQAGSGNDVAVVNRDGSGFSVLTNTPDSDLEPDWSPDGGRIVFTRAGNSREVFVMNSDGSNQTNVSNQPEKWAGQPDWRPAP